MFDFLLLYRLIVRSISMFASPTSIADLFLFVFVHCMAKAWFCVCSLCDYVLAWLVLHFGFNSRLRLCLRLCLRMS